MNNATEIKSGRFKELECDLRYLRTTVFIEEQFVPPELEWDEEDQQAQHVVVYSQGSPVATARILADGRIGRMAVLKPWRSKGIGSLLLGTLEAYAQQHGLKSVYLSAQQHAVKFYEKHGYEVYSDLYMDANIPHFSMKKSL